MHCVLCNALCLQQCSIACAQKVPTFWQAYLFLACFLLLHMRSCDTLQSPSALAAAAVTLPSRAHAMLYDNPDCANVTKVFQCAG